MGSDDRIWYCEIEGKPAGPYSEAQLARWLETGHVRVDTPVQHRDDVEWVAAANRASVWPRLERERRVRAAMAEVNHEKTRYDYFQNVVGWYAGFAGLMIFIGIFSVCGGLGNVMVPYRDTVPPAALLALLVGVVMLVAGLVLGLLSVIARGPLVDIARSLRILERDSKNPPQQPPAPPPPPG